MTSEEAESGLVHHLYVSTYCMHGDHKRCKTSVGIDREGGVFARRGSRCKVCESPCLCRCHWEPAE